MFTEGGGWKLYSMISLNFKIDEAYLVYHTITNCSPHRFVDERVVDHIVDFQNLAWSMDQKAYQFLRFGFTDADILGPISISQLAERATKLVETLVGESSFKKLLDETSESLIVVQQEWECNLSRTNEVVRDLIGTEPEGSFQVFVTHPSLKQGHYLSDLKSICWSNQNKWPNYNTVYLWHELLHAIIPGGDLEHAIIQLIADNELRVRLNGGSYPPSEGHPCLLELTEVLLPFWQRYLSESKRNITQFISQVSNDDSVRSACDKVGIK